MSERSHLFRVAKWLRREALTATMESQTLNPERNRWQLPWALETRQLLREVHPQSVLVTRFPMLAFTHNRASPQSQSVLDLPLFHKEAPASERISPFRKGKLTRTVRARRVPSAGKSQRHTSVCTVSKPTVPTQHRSEAPTAVATCCLQGSEFGVWGLGTGFEVCSVGPPDTATSAGGTP